MRSVEFRGEHPRRLSRGEANKTPKKSLPESDSSQAMLRGVQFVPAAFLEYQKWIETDRKTALRIGDLIKDILRDPCDGIGKPEALRYQFKGYWSRRIDQEHRLIYTVTETSVVIISCFSHY